MSIKQIPQNCNHCVNCKHETTEKSLCRYNPPPFIEINTTKDGCGKFKTGTEAFCPVCGKLNPIEFKYHFYGAEYYKEWTYNCNCSYNWKYEG
jgi:hypothetical protein